MQQLHIPFSNREHTGADFNDVQKIRWVKYILTLLKFTFKQYRPLAVMYRISFERFCRKSITVTYTIFNTEHAGVTYVSFVAIEEY